MCGGTPPVSLSLSNPRKSACIYARITRVSVNLYRLYGSSSVRAIRDLRGFCLTAATLRRRATAAWWRGSCSDAAIRARHSFVTSKAGSVASTFALALIPIMLSAGAAVDYSLANKAKAQLNAAADAAALAAVDKSAMNTSDTAAKKTALDFFNAYASTVRPTVTLQTVTANITGGLGRTAVVSYTASVPTTLLAAAS